MSVPLGTSSADEIWTVKRVLDWTTGRFTERRLASPRLDAELLLAHVLSWKRVELYTRFEQPLQPSELGAYRELIKRRLGGESVAYLLGRRAFHALELAVDARVLVPRPETEHLVDAVLERAREGARVVDIGTGSGAIALAVKHARPDLDVTAVDISPDALAVARGNAERLALVVRFVQSDLFAALGDERFDIIVSNPPYIPSGDIAGLPLDVRKEPHLALDGGKDGLVIVERILAAAAAHLVPSGWLLFELGEGQAPTVRERLRQRGFGRVATVRDFGDIERIVLGQLGAVDEPRPEPTLHPEPEPESESEPEPESEPESDSAASSP